MTEYATVVCELFEDWYDEAVFAFPAMSFHQGKQHAIDYLLHLGVRGSNLRMRQFELNRWGQDVLVDEVYVDL